MPAVTIDLDDHSLTRLAELAFLERRSVPAQAEVLLRKAVGSWPLQPVSPETERPDGVAVGPER